MLGVERRQVISALLAGELRGYDARRPGARRALYRIPAAALDEFRQRRAIVPPAESPRRSRHRPVIAREYV